MRLGIIVGHTKKQQGAQMAPPHNISEYVYNSEIARLAKEFADKNPEIETEIFFRDVIGTVAAYNKAAAKKCDCVVELHFNAANEKAFGTETLCSEEKADQELAAFFQNEIESVFGRVDHGSGDRGIKILKSDDRGSKNVVSYPGKANCLVEPFFGDNSSEAEMAMARKQEYAEALINAAIKWNQSQDNK